MTENGKGYAAILKINLPPDEQYHSGHSLILQADGPGQLGLLLQELDQTQSTILGRIRDFAKATDAVAPAAVLTAAVPPSPYVASTVTSAQPATLTVEQVAAQLGANVPATTAGPPPQPAPVPAPAGAAQSGFRSAPKVDGSQVGGSPGQQYPQGAQLGGPCPKCSVVTWWQEAFVKPDGDAVPAYWRCPNAKNHPKAY